MSLKYVLRDAPGKVPPGGISSKLSKTALRRKKPFSQVGSQCQIDRKSGSDRSRKSKKSFFFLEFLSEPMSLKYVLRDAPGKVPPGGISSKLRKTALRRKKPFSQVQNFAFFCTFWSNLDWQNRFFASGSRF